MQVTCTDFYGKKHQVDSSQLIDRVSVYGICIMDSKVLLIQDPRTLRWELPGGGVEKSETLRQGLVREFKEEANVTPGPSTFLTEWQEYFFDVVSQQAWRSQRKFFLVKGIDQPDNLLKVSNGEDSGKAEFLSVTSLDDLHVAEATKKVVALANNQQCLH